MEMSNGFICVLVTLDIRIYQNLLHPTFNVCACPYMLLIPQNTKIDV